jgi:hypothetical protein
VGDASRTWKWMVAEWKPSAEWRLIWQLAVVGVAIRRITRNRARDHEMILLSFFTAVFGVWGVVED